MAKKLEKTTPLNLALTCRMAGIAIEVAVIKRVIDVIELIEEKGMDAKLSDIAKLQSEWSK